MTELTPEQRASRKASRKRWELANPDFQKAYRQTERGKAIRKSGMRKAYLNRSPEQRKKAILNGAKCNARSRGIAFDLKVSDLVWPEKCPVLGIVLNYGAPTNGRNSVDSPSLDRHDPSVGYVKGNVVVMSWRANRLKCDANVHEIEKLLSYMRQRFII